ncbi:hypothetical protein ACOMHN_009426 [Nucella lapillus]
MCAEVELSYSNGQVMEKEGEEGEGEEVAVECLGEEGEEQPGGSVFHCDDTNTQCIRRDLTCDGVAHCMDGKDESVPVCGE